MYWMLLLVGSKCLGRDQEGELWSRSAGVEGDVAIGTRCYFNLSHIVDSVLSMRDVLCWFFFISIIS